MRRARFVTRTALTLRFHKHAAKRHGIVGIDLKGASTQDYKNAYADLAELGFSKDRPI